MQSAHTHTLESVGRYGARLMVHTHETANANGASGAKERQRDRANIQNNEYTQQQLTAIRPFFILSTS